MLRPFLLHALSPLHAGTGHSADVIDLPIARMKGTNIPIAPGSGIKGVLRDARLRNPKTGVDDWEDQCWATFGPETTNAADHAGALIVGDARLLALPVRSFKGAFAWVTSPLLLILAKRDLCGIWGNLGVPSFPPLARGARVNRLADGAIDSICLHDGKLFLQDLDLDAQSSVEVQAWAAKLHSKVSPEGDIFTKRFAVVDDDTMAFLWETATQVDQRIRIDEKTRTVVKGALWREESLPPETLLVGLLEASRSRKQGLNMSEEEVMDFALKSEASLQFGGKATVGRGRCRMIPISA